jgi:hypothetical protein
MKTTRYKIQVIDVCLLLAGTNCALSVYLWYIG